MSENIVVAGAGHAAGQLVTALKQRGYEGSIMLVGDEPYPPYQRPPLSKKYLSGELPAARLNFKPERFYDDSDVELRTCTRIESIDRSVRELYLGSGECIRWDRLVLATGSRARLLPVPGADLDGVHYLRTIADVDAIRADAVDAEHAVIVGAGYIGLEVAAVLRKTGLEVTIVEMADRVMSRVVSPEISDFYQIEHAEHGVKLRLSTSVTAFRGDARVIAVETGDGEQIPADFVIVGIGVEPNIELAQDAGLDVDNGIIVDDRCRTTDSNVFAIGDCTTHPNDIYGRKLRLESVHNALEQAKTAAANLCGTDTRYSQVPWFWSDQYDLKLQIAGLSDGYDDIVIRGNPADRSFACFYLRDGVLIAVDAVNAPREFMQSKALITNRAQISPADLADTSRQLKEFSV